jgi:hypothetical protein
VSFISHNRAGFGRGSVKTTPYLCGGSNSEGIAAITVGGSGVIEQKTARTDGAILVATADGKELGDAEVVVDAVVCEVRLVYRNDGLDVDDVDGASCDCGGRETYTSTFPFTD